jgi:hypothetical protein
VRERERVKKFEGKFLWKFKIAEMFSHCSFPAEEVGKF